MSDTLGEIRGFGIVRNGMDDNGLKWWAVIYAVDFFLSCLEGWSDVSKPAKRENGEAWGFVGYEDGQLPEECDMGLTAFTDEKQWAAFKSYQIPEYNMYRRARMINGNTAGFLGEVIRKKRKASSFTDFEKDRWQEIENRFAHVDEDGSITPDILVMEGNELEEIGRIWKRHPLYDKAMEFLQEDFNKIVRLLQEGNNPAAGLEEQLAYYASMEILAVRMMTVRSEVNSGRLAVPEEPENSTVAMWLEIGE